MSDDLKSGVLGSKDAEIKQLDLINSSGQPIDLKRSGQAIELIIHQSIYDSCMYGTLLVSDAQDIFYNYHFCGNEFLQISIDKPTLGEPIEKIFRIYKVTDRRKGGNSAQTFIVHFCSIELILSKSIRVSKAYKGKAPTEIVNDILTNYLKVTDDKIARLESTNGKHNIIIPNYHPFEAIQWVASRAYSDSPKYCYYFFENSRGYNFVSSQTLYRGTGGYTKTIKFEVKNAEEPDAAVNRDSADKHTILNDFDALTSTENASYAAKLLNVDLFQQSYDYIKYSADTLRGQKLLLNEYLPINDLKDVTGNTAVKAYDSYLATYANINNVNNNDENYVDKWKISRAQQMSLLNNFRIQVVVPGDTSMNAGDVVKVEFPKSVAPDEAGKESDDYRSGKYLVSSIKHKFVIADDTYECTAVLCSDSFAAQLPAAKDLIKGFGK